MNANAPSEKPRFLRNLFTCESRAEGLLKIMAVVVAIILLIPMTRKWVFYGISGGKWVTPKGYPFAEPWRDWDKPTDPRELAAYEYAHSLKLPDSMPQPVPFSFTRHLLSNRRATARAYFDHLCKTEGGEYIFKTVEKVEGLYQMRAMPKWGYQVLSDRYGFEDPADWSAREADGSPTLFIGGAGNGFRYFESASSPTEIATEGYRRYWTTAPWINSGSAPYWRYHHFDNTRRWGYTYGEVTPISSLESRYAYTWRGIRREKDREYGIAGGEMIVLDRITGEILGVRRSFAIARQSRNALSWEFAYFCPSLLRPIRQDRRVDKLYYPFSFVFQVLNPVDFDPVAAVQPKS